MTPEQIELLSGPNGFPNTPTPLPDSLAFPAIPQNGSDTGGGQVTDIDTSPLVNPIPDDIPNNSVMTNQSIDDKIQDRLNSSNTGDRLEGTVAQGLGGKVNDIGRIEYDTTGRPIGEIDIETDSYIVEVTTSRGGKLEQAGKLIENTQLNPDSKTVVVFAPDYSKFAEKDLQDIGVKVVRNLDDLNKLIDK